MTAHERILALRLLEKFEQDPNYARKIGVKVSLRNTGVNRKEDNNA